MQEKDQRKHPFAFHFGIQSADERRFCLTHSFIFHWNTSAGRRVGQWEKTEQRWYSYHHSKTEGGGNAGLIGPMSAHLTDLLSGFGQFSTPYC